MNEKHRLLEYARVRPDTLQSIDDFVNKGWSPGDFVYAVLTNNLRDALGLADDDNRGAIFEIVFYCYNEIPSQAWGSPERVMAWLNKVRAKPEEARA